jgi:signal transduction histidine kinase
MVLEFVRNQAKAFQASFDVDEVAAVGSDPKSTLAAMAAQCAFLAVIAYAPVVSTLAQFRQPWVALLLTCLAGVLTLTAGHFQCRGPVGTLATLFDNAFWSAALAYAALNTRGGIAIALAVIQAVVLLGFTTQWYSLTLPLGLVLGVPTLAMVALFPALEAVKVILLATLAMALIMARLTGRRRALLDHKRQLERALGASEKLAEDSMQIALSATLLNLGHFLHELRNHQTAISTNLAYIEAACGLDGKALAALSEAREAQEAQSRLVRTTIDELRQKGRVQRTTFLLRDALLPFAERSGQFEVVVECEPRPIALTGNPDHFALVLTNLIRNARQAGARRVHLDARLGPSGQSAQVLVYDDGPGIPRERRDRLFQPFGESTRPDGTGFGLYLCRRHVELFGGTLTLQDGPLGGAEFILQLPATVELPVGSEGERQSVA